ncbi:hypothetical protein [Devosia sp. A449]
MTSTRKPKDVRELASRALCAFESVPEDTLFDGRPMWMSYLEEVGVMLQAVEWKPGVDDMPPASNLKPARELAARALCRFDGHPEDTKFERRPM